MARGCPELWPSVGLGCRPACGLTQELLEHLAIVEVLLQLLHDDPLLHQDVADPVRENLGRGRSEGLARPYRADRGDNQGEHRTLNPDPEVPWAQRPGGDG